MDWIEFESLWFDFPSFADELVGRESFEGLQSPSEIVRADEVREMPAELIMAVVVVAFDGRVLDGSVHPFDLTVVRYVIRRRLAVRLFSKRGRRYGEPILGTGRREHEGAGRPILYVELRARVCSWPPLRLARLRCERESVVVV